MPEDIKCPICGSGTVIKTAKKGPNAGQSFYVCKHYPECKGRVSISKEKDVDGFLEEQKEHTEVPKQVEDMLLPTEQIVATMKQSRLKAAVTPDTIIVTDERIIRYSPSTLGIRKEIADYRYCDMANCRVNKGIMFATITIKQRFSGEDLVLGNLPKGPMGRVSKLIQEKIRQTSGGIPTAAASQPVASTQTESPIELLKLRLVKGEITKEQYEEMRQILD
jgi:ssDNA-binding Zn-finger/Zn-ribbon topoisomerase 1